MMKQSDKARKLFLLGQTDYEKLQNLVKNKDYLQNEFLVIIKNDNLSIDEKMAMIREKILKLYNNKIPQKNQEIANNLQQNVETQNKFLPFRSSSPLRGGMEKKEKENDVIEKKIPYFISNEEFFESDNNNQKSINDSVYTTPEDELDLSQERDSFISKIKQSVKPHTSLRDLE